MVDNTQTSIAARTLNKTLEKAEQILRDTYIYDLPVSVLRILCVIYRNHLINRPTYLEDLVKELAISKSSVSRSIAKMAVWMNLKSRGAGYLDKEMVYNDAGRQVVAIHMTEKGATLMEGILMTMTQ